MPFLSAFLLIFAIITAKAGPVIEPALPGENVPQGIPGVDQELIKNAEQLLRLPAQYAGMGAQVVLPGEADLRKGLELYRANRNVCIADQARASNFCREETSPNLQTTLAGVNLVLAGVNSLAVNDACKGFSKAMSLAQAGLTAYTAACGMMRKKCNMSCEKARQGVTALLGGALKSATCVSINPAVCTNAMAQANTYIGGIDQGVNKEVSLSDKKSLKSKYLLCQHTYGLLLASSGASILSLVNSIKSGQKCDDDSDGSGSSSSSSTAAASVGAATSTETASASTEAVPPTNAAVSAEVAPSDSTLDRGVSNVGEIKSASVDASGNSELRAYLPGGERAVSVSAKAPANPDITSATGKSNFEKTSIRLREILAKE